MSYRDPFAGKLLAVTMLGEALSGKTTLGTLLAGVEPELFRVIDTGTLLRSARAKHLTGDTEYQGDIYVRLHEQYGIANVDSDVLYAVLEAEIRSAVAKLQHGLLIFTGSPRRLLEAHWLYGLLTELRVQGIQPVLLTASFKERVRRAERRKRDQDDSHDGVTSRDETFATDTAPVISWLKSEWDGRHDNPLFEVNTDHDDKSPRMALNTAGEVYDHLASWAKRH